MLGQSCRTVVVRAFKSTIENDTGGLGCSARDTVENKVKIGFYSGTISYTNIYRDKDVEEMYGEAVMSVSEIEFNTYTGPICHDMKDSD